MRAVDHAAMPGMTEVSVMLEDNRNPACPIKCKMELRLVILALLWGAAPR
jgi:hypothetical protein